MQSQRDTALTLTVVGALGASAVLIALPVFAQSDAQVGRVVEAIRQASKPDKPTTGLYSDWQVKPENISRWSKQCNGREATPTEFQNNAATARSIVTCVVRDVLKQEYRASNNNESVAVQRVAAWWLTGDPNRYNSQEAAPYVQKALAAYQGGTAPTAATSDSQSAPRATFYDRYMQAGYAASQKKDTQTALLYFRRALDERPQDQFAQQAIRNIESKPNRATSSSQSNPRR